jgi:hypothetical protein
MAEGDSTLNISFMFTESLSNLASGNKEKDITKSLFF